ncbi:hypothetical protein CBG25_15460 [Arsenophonus sp. ENCA]|uniref:hypothetical protein n=1 Tax=Arsenophonus sp. ENCA TaxID=1987579 RepID=UPI000BCB9C82|nr:hypothetical protein [Arsenophonus sp. ENCA]PAV01642.1 hypothetical protein CBG25_15460 [Arsenophonus sp. ENCA]
MKFLVFHLLIICLGTFVALKITDSVWMTILLVVSFGAIPLLRLNRYYLEELTVFFVFSVGSISILFALIKSQMQ